MDYLMAESVVIDLGECEMMVTCSKRVMGHGLIARNSQAEVML